MVFKKGDFTTYVGETPEQLARRRAVVAAVTPKFGSAKTVGEGLGQLFMGIGLGRQQRAFDEAEAAGRKGGAAAFSGLFGNATQSTSGQSGPMNILGVDPGYAAPTKPDPLAPSMGQDADKPIYPNEVTPGGYAMGADVPGAAAGGSADAIFRAELIAGGLPEHVADGILMNAFDESGFNPGIVGDNGGAFGLLQWNGPRKRALEQFAAQVGGNPADPRIQAQFTLYELNGPESAAGRALAGATTPGEAAAIFLNQYERPAEVHRAKREAKYLGGGGTLSGGPVAAPAGASMATNSAMPFIDPQALITALANPWLSPEERSVLTTIYDQQVQAGDPLRQIEVAKGMAELEKMNAPPAPPEDFTTRIFLAQQAGLEPGSEAFQTYLLTGKLPETDPEAPQTQTFYDEETGQEYRGQWNPQTGQWERVGGVKALGGDASERYRAVGGQVWDFKPEGGGPPVLIGGTEEIIYGPDGNPIVVRGASGTAGKMKLTEGQSKDNVFVTRAEGALKAFEEGNPGALLSFGESAAGSLPFGVGRYMQGNDYQTAENQGNEFLQAILRKDTGAAITVDEQRLYGDTYLPRPGDGPAVLEAKKLARARAVEAMKSGMDPRQVAMTEQANIAAIARAGANPVAPATPAPAAGGGATINGYTIKPVN